MENPQEHLYQPKISILNMGIDLSEIEKYLKDLRQYPHQKYPIKNRKILYNHHILALDETQNLQNLPTRYQENFQQAILYFETSEYLKAIDLLSLLVSDVEITKNSHQTLIQINEMLAYCYFFLAKSEKDQEQLSNQSQNTHQINAYLLKAKDCFDECLKLQEMNQASIDDQIQIYMGKAKLEFKIGDQVQAQHLIHQAFEMKKKWHWVDIELLMLYLEIQLLMQKEINAKVNLYTRIKAIIGQIIPNHKLFKEYFAERIFHIGNWMLKQNFIGFSDLIYQDAIKMAPWHKTLQKVASRRGWQHLHVFMNTQQGEDEDGNRADGDDHEEKYKGDQKTNENKNSTCSYCYHKCDEIPVTSCLRCVPDQIPCLTMEAAGCLSADVVGAEACACLSCPLDCGFMLLMVGGIYQLYMSFHQFLI